MSRTGGGRGTNQHGVRGTGKNQPGTRPRQAGAANQILISAEMTADRIRHLLGAIADEMGDGPPVELIVSGGAYMALHGIRESTQDIDSATALDSEIAAAAHRVSQRLGMPGHTLNSNAKAFTSSADLYTGRTVLFQQGRLIVCGPSPETVLLLKLRASRPQRDEHDIINLFPLCNFASISEIADRYAEAFPEEPHDEFLPSHIAKLAERAGVSLPASALE